MTANNIYFKVVDGNLPQYKADIIVNSTNKALHLNHGFLSQSLLKQAGPKIQEECATKYPRGIDLGQVAITKGYSLQCQYVFHVALPAWDYADMEGSRKSLCDMICSCLKLAHDNKMESIAFPALGCGFLDYPPDVAANTMVQCVSMFNNPDVPTSLREVSVVIRPQGGDWKLVKWTFLRELHGPEGQFEKFPRSRGQQEKGIFSTLLSFIKTSSPDMDVADSGSFVAEHSATPKPKQQRFTASMLHHRDKCCTKLLPCRHPCLGYKGETKCPPCLQAACRPHGQTVVDDCIICYTHPLMAAPVLMLGCSHVFHVHCVQRILENRWVGPRITFNFLLCPICKKTMEHPLLDHLLLPIRELFDDVSRKAMMRAQYDNLDKTPEVTSSSSPYYRDVQRLALDRYCYYPCSKCGKAYFGGMAQCEDGAAGGSDVDEAEMVCGACSGVKGEKVCSIHKEEFIEYKCRYCCSVAVFFCFGTTHFCHVCHSNPYWLRSFDPSQLPRCPAGANAVQLTGACPLGIEHVPTGEEMCLGCGLCYNIKSF